MFLVSTFEPRIVVFVSLILHLIFTKPSSAHPEVVDVGVEGYLLGDLTTLGMEVAQDGIKGHSRK